MLLHAFIDESEYRDKYFILSALIVEDDKLKQLNSDLKALLSDYCRGIPTLHRLTNCMGMIYCNKKVTGKTSV
ncbi:hypothetical protein FRC0418_00045 [Corynebacterium diphtheriae]|nr:hypothetical protein CIP107538_00252 [Corynebacterium diphtheriae]CAB0876339.1 hypothetical protein FRC0406_00274 [Corynebacterium diphtheriae]CAB0885089.1 hypothetical protein FRC0418_00045 [Corynebacterium diphtheriae]